MDTADELDAVCRRSLYLCGRDRAVSFCTILSTSLCCQAGEVPGIELGVAHDLEALFDNYAKTKYRIFRPAVPSTCSIHPSSSNPFTSLEAVAEVVPAIFIYFLVVNPR